MNDNALMALLISTISAGMTAQGITVGIKQNYQPTKQGTPTLPTLFLFKLHDVRLGFPKRKDVWNVDDEIMEHTETEIIESTYQVNALAIQNPANTTQLTANDYLRRATMVLQSDNAIKTLFNAGVGIYGIRAIRTVFFTDDKDNQESNPHFEFTVNHRDEFTDVINSTVTLVPDLTDF